PTRQPEADIGAEEAQRLWMPQRSAHERLEKKFRPDPPDHDPHESFRIEAPREIADHTVTLVHNPRRLRLELRIVIREQIRNDLPVGKKPLDGLAGIGRVS